MREMPRHEISIESECSTTVMSGGTLHSTQTHYSGCTTGQSEQVSCATVVTSPANIPQVIEEERETLGKSTRRTRSAHQLTTRWSDVVNDKQKGKSARINTTSSKAEQQTTTSALR
jgi:hypothetical protein